MIFQKFCASGNDFLITHTLNKKSFKKSAITACDRHYGFGADGLIVLVPHIKYDFEWLFYNSDGSLADMCGNGARACALYAYKNGIAGRKMSFLTGAGVINAEVFGKNLVQTQLTKYTLINEKILEHGMEWFFVNTGVPHLCSLVQDIESFDIAMARELRYKYNANVNIFAIKDEQLYVRTYERGVEDETLACGTGMCACALYTRYLKAIEKVEITVNPKSREQVSVTVINDEIYFKGVVTGVGSCLQFA